MGLIRYSLGTTTLSHCQSTDGCKSVSTNGGKSVRDGRRRKTEERLAFASCTNRQQHFIPLSFASLLMLTLFCLSFAVGSLPLPLSFACYLPLLSLCLSFLVSLSLSCLSFLLALSRLLLLLSSRQRPVPEQGGKGGKEGSLNRGRQDTAAKQGMGRKEVVERKKKDWMKEKNWIRERKKAG